MITSFNSLFFIWKSLSWDLSLNTMCYGLKIKEMEQKAKSAKKLLNIIQLNQISVRKGSKINHFLKVQFHQNSGNFIKRKAGKKEDRHVWVKYTIK